MMPMLSSVKPVSKCPWESKNKSLVEKQERDKNLEKFR